MMPLLLRARPLFLAPLLLLPLDAPAQRPPPVIDMHLHAERGTSRQDWAGVLRGLEAHGVVVAMLSVDDSGAVHSRELSSERFWLGAAFPCYEGRYPQMDPCFEEGGGWPDIAWLRRQFESGRMRMMGEMLYVYFGIPPADERLAPYWALAEELDIPVGVHTGRGPYLREKGCCPRFDDDLGNPSLLEPVLRRHPKLRVWLMHAPGWDYLDETIAVMQSHPNVYSEMSIVNSVMPAGMHQAHLQAIADAGLLDRVMFGSDNVPIAPILERIESVPFLSERQKRAILYDNAARFLRLTGDEIARHHGRPNARTAVGATVTISP